MIPRLLLIFAGMLAYGLQTHFYLEGDVIYLVHAAQQLLHGGSYQDNFFETNPPMILYLYWPVILFMQVFKINLVIATRIYVIGLALASVTASNYWMKQSQLDTKTRYSLLAAITLVLLFLPICEFAQREHLLLILTMPYWFLVLLRTENAKVSAFPAFFTGLSAGLGFAIKPFFLPPLLFCEAYLCWRAKSLTSLLRPETFSLFLLFSLYILSLFLFQPDYLHFILPWVSKYYFSGAAESWSQLLDRPPALFCLVVALFIPAYYKFLRSSVLGLIFSFALLGFILSFLLPKTAWYYHALPALGMSLLLGALLIAEIPNRLMAGGLALIFLSVPLSYGIQIYNSDAAIANNPPLNELIQFANQLPGHSRESGNLPSIKAEDSRFRGNDKEITIYCIPTHRACSIVSAYAPAKYISRFPSLWALRGILNQDPSPEVQIDEYHFLSLLFRDLNKTQPQLVVFDNTIGLPHLKSSQDYLAYFSRYAEFNEVWAHYHFLKRIGPYEIYTYQG